MATANYKFDPEEPEVGAIAVTLDKITRPVGDLADLEGKPLAGGEPEGGWPEGTVGAELDTRDAAGGGSAAGEPGAEGATGAR